VKRIVNLAFTGACVVTPAYRNSSTAQGPIRVLMPSAPRARFASDLQTQIDAHFAYSVFAQAHLDDTRGNRQPDFSWPVGNQPAKGVCFFHDETIAPVAPPLNRAVTFDESGGDPSEGSTDARWIANWHRFAATRNPLLISGGDAPLVRIELPAGHISSRFVTAPVTKIRFAGSDAEEPDYYAHEIVVSLEYPDDAEAFVLRSMTSNGQPADLAFRWGDADAIEIAFGNGSLASITNVLDRAVAGHTHRSTTDYEFELLYDIIQCMPDMLGRRPVPQLCGREILRVPCLASMI
jgi:hypothetical protein